MARGMTVDIPRITRLAATREARERATDGRMIKKGLHFFYGCDIMLRGK